MIGNSTVKTTGATVDPKAPAPDIMERQTQDTKGSTPVPGTISSSSEEALSWASKAWGALHRALLRYPGPVRCPDAKEDDSFEKRCFILRYAKRFELGTSVKWLKFHTSYIFARAMGQEEMPLPPNEEWEGEQPGRFCGGRLGRALQEMMARGRAGSWPHRRCAYDILMSKIGMPPAPESFIKTTMEDHKKAVCSDRSPENEGDTEMLTEVESRISEIVRVVFRGQKFTHVDPVPSLRACFDNGLSDGGALGRLARDFLAGHSTFSFVLAPDQLFGMVVQRGVLYELRLRDMTDLVCDFQNWVDSVVRSRLDEPLDAIPVSIREPLKVRVITKGQAPEYYRCIEYQKFMHRCLKRWKVFEYIGHPIDDASWRECFGLREDLKADEFFVSGDYKAATDNLRPDLSEFTWRAICGACKNWEGETLLDGLHYRLGIKALTHHRLRYGTAREPDARDQKWGQLMGSPMSFPILCIVNCAATLAALGLHFSNSLKMKVNGDDIGFIANKEQYETWGKYVRVCGLEPSLGKNYVSRDFLIMNSELRRPPSKRVVKQHTTGRELVFPESGGEPHWEDVVVEFPEPCPWKLEGFLNQSLLHNLVKKGVDAGSEKSLHWPDLSSLTHEMLKGLPKKNHWAVYGVFFRTYRQVLEEMPAMCNKWFQSELGGAGFCIPSDRTVKELVESTPEDLLQKQLKQAAVLACNPALRLKLEASLYIRPTTGVFGQVMSGVLRQCDDQIPRVIQNKPLNREQKTVVGGTTLLGYLLHGLDQEDLGTPGEKKVAMGGQVAIEPIEGDKAWRIHSQKLRRSYERLLKGCHLTSLSPMNLDHCCGGFKEHLRAYSRIEILREHCTDRWPVP